MTLNTSNRKSIRSAERAAREVERARGEVITGLMATAPGREWLWTKLSEANVFSTTYHDNPHRMSFLEGQRNAGLTLLADIMQWCPDLFIQAMREANVRRSTEQPDADPDTDSGEHPGGEEPGRLDQGPSVDPSTGEVRYNA